MRLPIGARNRNRTGTPVIHEAADFLTTMAFATSRAVLWSGLYLCHGLRFRPPPSSLYTFPCGAWLGIGISQRSPNLTGSTPGVSTGALKLFKSDVSTYFTIRAASQVNTLLIIGAGHVAPCTTVHCTQWGRNGYLLVWGGENWRRGPESNRTNRICNPGHNRFATAPL